MARPPKCRRISSLPGTVSFKPAGIPARELEEVALTLDELEALRLADLEGLYQEAAATRMNVSRQTFANILAAARRKTAEAIVFGRALRIEGGSVEVRGARFVCHYCRHIWDMPSGEGGPARCPRCAGEHICRTGGEDAADPGREKPCSRRKACCREKEQEGKE